jgi:hypothetical protein
VQRKDYVHCSSSAGRHSCKNSVLRHLFADFPKSTQHVIGLVALQQVTSRNQLLLMSLNHPRSISECSAARTQLYR